MLAHARVPAIDPDPNKISTTSSKLVTGVLKEQLGFKGVVLTDALEMKGIMTLYDPKKGSPTALAAVDAVKAGCDVIMTPTDLDGAFHAIVESVRSGEIPESRIDESVRKILEMKASVGLNKSRLVEVEQASTLVSQPVDLEFAQHIADEAVTLVRDNKKVLPLQRSQVSESKGEHRIVAILIGEAFASTDGKEFEKALKSRRPDVNVFYFDNRTSDSVSAEALKAAAEAEQIVLAVYVAHNGTRNTIADGKVLNTFGPLGASGRLLERVLGIAAEKTVVVDLGSPYLIMNFPQIQTYICAYAMASTSEISVVKALFGEIQNHGRLPVTLPGIAPRGFSLPWPTSRKGGPRGRPPRPLPEPTRGSAPRRRSCSDKSRSPRSPRTPG